MKKEEEERGRCLECGNELPYGRSDMKFCSVSCKSRYHYENRPYGVGVKLRTLSALDRNHSILEGLIEQGRTEIEIPDLAQMGYNFSCITSYQKVRNHHEYRCFDIKYFMSSGTVSCIQRCIQPMPGKKR